MSTEILDELQFIHLLSINAIFITLSLNEEYLLNILNLSSSIQPKLESIARVIWCILNIIVP